MKVLEPGTLLAGRYELLDKLGEGGMGVVYRAKQINLGREVALKLLPPGEDGGDALRRFEREAKVAAALKHPNVVEIYDVGEHEGVVFLAMELLRGAPLRALVGDAGEPLGLAATLEIACSLSEALIAAHAIGLVHRDLKPENVFVEQIAGRTTRVVVVDFGLAFITDSEDLGRKTQAGLVIGTPDYLSPEQAMGGEIGPPSDLYSLGIMLYELLTGRVPFAGNQLNVLTQHLYVNPPAPSRRIASLPRELDELVLALLRKRPEERPAASEVFDTLELLASTLAGRRPRGREAYLLHDRATRMISLAPTMPVVRALTPVPPQRGHELGVGVVGPLDEDIELGLLSNELALYEWPSSELGGSDPEFRLRHASLPDLPDSLAVVFAPHADPEQVAILVRDSGLPVVACVAPHDRQQLAAMLRAGAAEVAALPLAIDNLVRALQRAARRRRRASPPAKP